ncbi:hypothetical protein SAMN05660420_00081 [Desulfuromusa kysingii]|uniref:Uncharacterized protein n=1 Tax=Desulfuromusa kysingii TaxID=37625 RepID=A0A1H3VIA0_9BACT|nr:hypothetical protein [Desulfuromusa kysingii]SDZ74523.1 hypothetical protein SAMN05660420_00081 [Desulfuromusa kysingii]
MHFAIMNNTPCHFVIASALLALFLWTTFFASESSQPKGLLAMHGLFVLVLISGCYVWTLVPFSLPLLIKSVGGIVLYGVMTQIVKNPKSVLLWSLFVAIATVGLGLAFTVI